LVGFGHRGERGITHLLFLIGVMTVMALIAVAGYSVFTHGDTKKTGYTTSNAFDKCLNANSNDRRLCNFQKAYTPISSTAYTATVSVTSPQGTVSNLTFSTDGKGNSEVSGTSDGQQLSSIVLGGITYVKVSGSGWIEYSANDSNAPAQINPTASMNIAVGQPGLSFQYLGTMPCDNFECYKYAINDSSQKNVTEDIWFDTTGYKLRQWSYQGSTGSTSMSIAYQPITITAPSPISANR